MNYLTSCVVLILTLVCLYNIHISTAETVLKYTEQLCRVTDDKTLLTATSGHVDTGSKSLHVCVSVYTG